MFYHDGRVAGISYYKTYKGAQREVDKELEHRTQFRSGMPLPPVSRIFSITDVLALQDSGVAELERMMRL